MLTSVICIIFFEVRTDFFLFPSLLMLARLGVEQATYLRIIQMQNNEKIKIAVAKTKQKKHEEGTPP